MSKFLQAGQLDRHELLAHEKIRQRIDADWIGKPARSKRSASVRVSATAK
jgi:hypothetical protein